METTFSFGGKNQISHDFKNKKFIKLSFVSKEKKDFSNLSRILLQSFNIIKVKFFCFFFYFNW
jgi:hypothetical protein